MCVLQHEFGHAIAAAIHRIPTECVGLFFSIVPGAYVRIEQDFSHLRPLQQLQIFFAGGERRKKENSLLFFCLSLHSFHFPSISSQESGTIL
jgi:hypothetical protein